MKIALRPIVRILFCGLVGCAGARVGADHEDGGAGIGSDANAPPSFDAGARDSASGCKSDAECSAGEVCAFLVADACEAEGKCVEETVVSCGAELAACACDGTTSGIACNYPPGYAPEPIAHLGVCEDGSTPGGPVLFDDGGPGTDATTGTPILDGGGASTDDAESDADAANAGCLVESDCAPGYGCAFALTADCGARGSCLAPSTSPSCGSYIPACGCDGTTFNLACPGFPNGYRPSPVAHDGPCDGGDAGP